MWLRLRERLCFNIDNSQLKTMLRKLFRSFQLVSAAMTVATLSSSPSSAPRSGGLVAAPKKEMLTVLCKSVPARMSACLAVTTPVAYRKVLRRLDTYIIQVHT